ncbi:hypothetical protein ACKWTF_008678 [Chironomus riparius]
MKIIILLIFFLSITLTTASENSCDYNEDCDPEKYCDNGECKTGCRTDESCSENEVCLHGKCEIGCRYDYQCKSDEFCDYDTSKCRTGCASDESCILEEYCDDDTRECIQGCRSDYNCKDENYCKLDTKECLPGCRSDFNCGKKEYCDFEDRLCKAGCSSEIACEDHEYCDYHIHKCNSTCADSNCGDNSKCSTSNHRQYCSCYDGYFPQRDLGCRPRTEADIYDNRNCSLYCGPYGKCLFKDNIIYCFCNVLSAPLANPYIECPSKFRKLSLKSAKTLMYG